VNAASDPVLAYRAELHRAASSRIAARRRRRLVAFAVITIGILVTGISFAERGWFTAEPAPKPVVDDFRAYTPQLGFHPEPGKALLVARDGEFKLYATTNREGTYCLVVDMPSRHPDVGDGGVCVARRDATEPIVAAVAALNVVVGRTTDSNARTIRFQTPEGESIEAPLGADGFFIAAVPIADECPAQDWAPTFRALGSDGTTLEQARILLVRVDPHACGWPNIPDGPDLRRGPVLGKGPY
jgi:hypothetical protein